MILLSTIILSIMTAPASAQECSSTVDQDLNCNGIEVYYEPPVDLLDPLCQSTLGADGNPLPNADYYYDYTSHGCAYPIINMDLDGDKLSSGNLQFFDDHGNTSCSIDVPWRFDMVSSVTTI